MPSRFPGISTVQTTDFFYPLVEDPYLQGRIACANVLSDLYAMGVSHCDNLLMLLAASREMEPSARRIVTRRMIEGFRDTAKEAGSVVTGGQTVLNPWPIIGGVASTVCKDEEIVMPTRIVPGNVFVLTKPLGTQVAVNLRQWAKRKDKNASLWSRAFEAWEKTVHRAHEHTHEHNSLKRKDNPAAPHQDQDHVQDHDHHHHDQGQGHDASRHAALFESFVSASFSKAQESMCRLNRAGASLMLPLGCTGATDVTGFGILGHASNLAGNQAVPLEICIRRIPVIAGMRSIDNGLNGMFGLEKGRSAETSGGLLAAFPTEKDALRFIEELEAKDGCKAWIVGEAKNLDTEKRGNVNTAYIADDVAFIEV